MKAPEPDRPELGPDSINARRQQLASVKSPTRPGEPARWLRIVRCDTAASATEPPAPVWEQASTERARIPTTSEVIGREHEQPPATLGGDLEARLLAALTSASAPGEGAAQAGNRREREAATIIAELGALDAHHLHRRLRQERKDDAIVAALSRMVVERRQRLLAILERRRRALAATAAVR